MQTLCSRAETSLNECEVISQDVGVQVRKKIGVLSLVVPDSRTRDQTTFKNSLLPRTGVNIIYQAPNCSDVRIACT